MNILCNLVIAAYILVAFGWNLPDGSVIRRLVQWFRGPILYSGLWHGWNMFAPDPLRVNRRLSATIYLADGSELAWKAKDLSHMSWWESFREVRDRKWQDNLMGDQLEYLRPSLCEHLAAIVRSDGLQVERIELIMERQEVPHPQTDLTSPNEYQRSVLYSYSFANSASANRPTSASTAHPRGIEAQTKTTGVGNIPVQAA